MAISEVVDKSIDFAKDENPVAPEGLPYTYLIQFKRIIVG